MKSQLSTKYLNKLKSKLPNGGMTEIANRLNISQSLVSKVFSGVNKNEKVIEEALLIIEETNNRRIELENRINVLA